MNAFFDFLVDLVTAWSNWNLRRPKRAVRLRIVPGLPVKKGDGKGRTLKEI